MRLHCSRKLSQESLYRARPAVESPGRALVVPPLRPWKIRLHDLAPGSHSTSPAPLHYHHTASRISLEIPNGWRVAGAIAPTQPSPAKTGFVPWSSPAAAFAKRPEMARAAERRNPFQEATGTPVMRQQDQRMKSGIRKSFRIALRRGACAGSSSSRRQTDGRGRSSWRQRRAASAPTRRRSSRRPAVRDIPAMP